MTLTLKSVAGLAAAAGLALLTSAASAQVTVTKYAGTGTKDTKTDITFTGLVLKTFVESNNFFDTERDTIALFNSGANYSGFQAFGLDVTGSFTVGAGGQTFTFSQRSDDGSYSFLSGPGLANNTPLIQIPGPTSSSAGNSPITKTLAAGTYNYEVKYSESNGAPGSLQFTSPVAVPEPSSVASMGLGAVGLLGLVLRARKGKAKRLSA